MPSPLKFQVVGQSCKVFNTYCKPLFYLKLSFLFGGGDIFLILHYLTFHISKSSGFHGKIWCVLNTHWYGIKKTCNIIFFFNVIFGNPRLPQSYNKPRVKIFEKDYTDRPIIFKCYFMFRLLERSTYLGHNYCQFLLVQGFCVSRLMRLQHLDDVWGELKFYNVYILLLTITVVIHHCNYEIITGTFSNFGLSKI